MLKLENDWTGTPVFLLTFRYDDKQCRHPDEKPCWVEFQIRANAFIFTRTIRDKDSESSIIEFLLNNGLISTDKVVFRLDTAPEETDGFKASIRHSFQQAFDEAGINANEALEGESGVEDSTEDHLLHRAIDWLVSHETPLREHGVQIEQNFHQQRYFTGNIRIEMQFTSKIDWFDVFAYAIFGEHRIPFPKLRKHLRKGNRRYQLPDGEIAILPEEWFAKYSRLLAFGKPDKENIRLQKHHFTIFNDLVDDVHQVGEDKPGQAASGKKGQVSDIRQRSAELVGLIEKESIPLPDIPVELKDILRPYQAKGFAWMHLLGEQGFGGCLADDMGLGKTLQCLTLLWKHKLNYRPEPLRHAPISKEGLQLDLFNDVANTAHHAGRTSLIVMPLSLIHNWENEIRKFTPGLSCIRYYGQNRESRPEVLMKHDLVLTTYGMVRNDLDFLSNFQFFYAILDESQLIKNPDSKVSRAVQRLKAENRLVLTGTPVENSLTDLWAQINFLNPGLLGNRKFFQKSFAIPIEKGGHENKQSALKKIIEPFILRRTKALVEKDLPDLTEKLHYCEMDAAQKRLYESKKSEIRNSIFAKAAGEDKSTLRFDILRGLMQLRLIANHPGLASKKGTPHPAAAADPYMALTDNENGFEPSGKFNEAIRIIENLRAEGHKLLIFSQFVKHLRLYRNFFDASNWGYAYLSGSQNALERQQAISAFREDAEKNLFLISLKAGGTGLNLTEADYVLLLDPWWNPAVEQQAISRAHRIGQQKPVIAYKFITSNTVEEKILKLQQKKTNLATDLIGTNDPFRLFSETEMIKILE